MLEIQDNHMDQKCRAHSKVEKEKMKVKITEMKLKYKKKSYDGDSALIILDSYAQLSEQRTEYFVSKMFEAVSLKNVQRMDEILKRFHGNNDKVLQDGFGNTLVALAIINKDRNMV